MDGSEDPAIAGDRLSKWEGIMHAMAAQVPDMDLRGLYAVTSARDPDEWYGFPRYDWTDESPDDGTTE